MRPSRAPRPHHVPGSDDLASSAAVDLDRASTDGIDDEDSRVIAEAERRWPAAREHLLSAGGPPLSSADVSVLLGTNERSVETARQKHRIVGVPDSTGSFVYPRWQFGADGPLPGLCELVVALRDDDPWTLVIFVLAPNSRLDDETPLDVLRRGDVEAVLRAAAMYGEHGAA